MSPDTPATTMPQHEVEDLLQILRHANARHSQLAAASRAVSRPAHKARKHAQALRLSVSVEAASRLDHKYISTIPLPVLELAPSPLPDADHAIHVPNATTAPETIAPIPRHPSQIWTDGLGKEVTCPERPVLRCIVASQVIISVDDVVSSVADHRILASKWSASTAGTGETEGDDFEEDIAESDVPQPPQVAVRYPRTEDNENMDILVSPDDDDHQDNDEAFAPIPPQFALHLPLVAIQVEPLQKHPLRPPLPTRIPRQAAPVRQQQKPRFSPQAAEAPGLAHFSSGSDSSQSSLELVSPITSEELPISLTRIKRKSLLDDVEMDGEDHYMAEKRPKYERKAFGISVKRRGHQHTASWSRRNV